MSKKGKVRQFPGPRGPQVPPQIRAPGVAGGPVVRQKISEIDWYKWRLAVQKEQTLIAKNNEIQRYKDLLAREEDNLRLRVQLLRMENQADIGHLNLAQGDQVIHENNEFFVVRTARQGAVPPVDKLVSAPPAVAAPEPPPLPPVPSADPDENEEVEDMDETTQEE